MRLLRMKSQDKFTRPKVAWDERKQCYIAGSGRGVIAGSEVAPGVGVIAGIDDIVTCKTLCCLAFSIESNFTCC